MRVVITGGPSVGKTTLVQTLEKRGYRVVHEIATQLIKEGKFLPWEDRGKFQAEVLRRQLEIESSLLEFDRITFLDRGAFDGEAYYRVDELPIPPTFSMVDPSQYDMAFLVEPLPFFDANEVRREDLEFTEKITGMIERCYRERNIKVLKVPFMAPDDRVNYILAEVERHKNRKVNSAEQAALMFRVNSATVPGMSTASVVTS